MQTLIVLVALISVSVAYVPYDLRNLHPIGPVEMHHAQGDLGDYDFWYNTPTQSRAEAKTPDGRTYGFYEYVDANGIPQKVKYYADAFNGFNVEATNLPVDARAPLVTPIVPMVEPIIAEKSMLLHHGLPRDTPEVAAKKIEHAIAYEKELAKTGHRFEDLYHHGLRAYPFYGRYMY